MYEQQNVPIRILPDGDLFFSYLNLKKKKKEFSHLAFRKIPF